jgi:isopentenyl diphosphate isomerase/L-lactate dehydrogenase-like FMN-dependent dehydrogenase
MGDQTNRKRGDSTEIAREYFDSLTLEFRMIDAVVASTEMNLFGETFATPVMVAALSRLHEVIPSGAEDTAKGAKEANSVMWAGIGSEQELEKMIDTGAKVIKIIKPYQDTDLIFRKIEHAEKNGVFAVGMDTDFVFGPKHNKGRALDFPVSPKTSEQLASYVESTNLPFIIKGVLSEQDAQKALDIGAAGIVVSNHCGAIIDFSAPPLKVLPRIKRIVDGKISIFLDCAINRGLDAFKAIALGADAVCVGRSVISALKENGSDGVRDIINAFTEELLWAMNVTGSRDLQSVDPGAIIY